MNDEALIATIKGDLGRLKDLLEQGINVNAAQDTNGWTLLHHAANSGHEEVIECLLRNGADVLVTSNKNNTALHIAVMTDDSAHAMVAILKNVARDKLRKLLNVKTKVTGSTALHIAAKHNLFYNVMNLLTFGADVEIPKDAGEWPVKVASEKVHARLEMISASFHIAQRGDATLLEALGRMEQDKAFIAPYTNCRNKQGCTLMQVLVLNDHPELASQLLVYLRDEHPMMQHEGDLLLDPSRKHEIDRLTEGARDFLEFWSEQKAAWTPLLASMAKAESSHVKKHDKRVFKMGCVVLKRAHEVLLAHRRFEGQKPFTLNLHMKSLEEVIEILGFDPEERYNDDCFYKKLPNKWKKDARSFVTFMECIIYKSINCYARRLTTVQVIHAVKENDVGKVQRLLGNDMRIDLCDYSGHTVLTYAVQNGDRKIVKLLLKSGAKIFENSVLPVLTLAADKGDAKIVKLLLKKADPSLIVMFIDYCPNYTVPLITCTALHAAARAGCLDVVRMLLRYGATYDVFDKEGQTPQDVSTNEEVTEFLSLVDSCFHDAEEANAELAYKLKAMHTDDFMAVAATRNRDGQTLAVVAAKANAKNIAGLILRMIRDAKGNEK